MISLRDSICTATSSIDEYHRQIIREITDNPPSKLASGFNAADYSPLGAFPGIVAELLQLPEKMQPALIPGLIEILPIRIAEEDFATSEWYFTKETSDSLAKKAALCSLPVTLVGCPSIAFSLSSLGRPSKLIDISPWVNLDKNIRRLHESADSIKLEEPTKGQYFLDPPWHMESYVGWLENLLPQIAVGSIVHIILPRPLSSKSSKAIREYVIKRLSGLGSFDPSTTSVRYKTPYFERGLLSNWFDDNTIDDWREGELLSVSIDEPAQCRNYDVEATRLIHDWEYIRIGRRVIRVSPVIPSQGEVAIEKKPERMRNPSLSEICSRGWNVISSNGYGMRISRGKNALTRELHSRALLENRANCDNIILRKAISVLLKDTHE